MHATRNGFVLRQLALAAMFALAPATPSVASQQTTTAANPVPLEANKSIEADPHGDEPQTFVIHAKSGQFIHVVVSEKKGFLSVSLADPSGKELAHNNTYAEEEPVSAIAESSGDFSLQVAPAEKGMKPGTFSVKLDELRAPTQNDRTRITAEDLMALAFDLYFTPDPAKKKIAISKWEEAGQLWHSIEDKLSEARTMKLLANALGESDPPKAAACFEEAAQLFESAGDKNWAADSMIGAGQIYAKLDEQDKSILAYQKVVTLAKAVSQPNTEALALDSIGDAYKALGKNEQALDYYLQSLAIFHQVKSWQEGFMLRAVGLLYQRMGQKQKALDYFEQDLAFQHTAGDVKAELVMLNTIGLVYDGIDQKQMALDYYNRALILARSSGATQSEGAALNNLGKTYADLGEKQKALDFYKQSLALKADGQDPSGEATTLANMGGIYKELGDRKTALDYYNRALDIERAKGFRAEQATTLDNIGTVHDDLGEWQMAMDFYNQALELRRAVHDREGEALTLSNVGNLQSEMGDKQKALVTMGQALPIERAMGNRSGEATTLNDMGSAYADTGEIAKATDLYTQAEQIAESIGDRGLQATTLNNLGHMFSGVRREKEALDKYTQALSVYRSIGAKEGEATALNNIGSVYLALGEPQKALDYYSQAIPLRKEVGDRDGEATTLNNIGQAYFDQNDVAKALDNYRAALELYRAVGDPSGEFTALNNVASCYFRNGDYSNAIDYETQSLQLREDGRNPGAEGTLLTNLGLMYDFTGKPEEALDSYARALPLEHQVGDPMSEASTMIGLMVHWHKQQNPNLSIFYGKEGINRIQEVRRNLQGMEKESQQSFLKSKEPYYRILAGLLISQGRLSEAQEVMGMLKLEEFSEFTQRRGDAAAPSAPVAMTSPEANANAELEKNEAEISAIGLEWSQLRAKNSRTPDEEQKYQQLSAQVTAANQKIRTFLNGLSASFAVKEANRTVEEIRGQAGGLQRLLTAGMVGVYTLVLDDKVVLIVVTPATQVAREVAIKSMTLRLKVNSLLTALQGNRPISEIQENSKGLYDLLIAPIQNDLDGAKAQTIVWWMDDVLRYIPMAALYDGKQYMVEKYREVVVTPASTGELNDAPKVEGWKALAMGVSKDYDGLGELKAVPGELDSVVKTASVPESHGPLPGEILLNDAFTEKDMEHGLAQHPPLVHIASHYVFHAGDDTKSYLLLGGEDKGGKAFHLTLADVENSAELDFTGVELLTLSACQTAMGTQADGREVDGLGMVAQQRGAKAVMATLWPVDDASVGKLMATFYKTWIATPGMTKAEALRQAQLALLHGDSGAAAGGAAAPYANPFYWAPFILIGNWK